VSRVGSRPMMINHVIFFFLIICTTFLGSVCATVQHVCSDAKFGDTLHLQCPARTVITSVQFASLSTKIGGSCSTTPLKQDTTSNYGCQRSINAEGLVGASCLFNSSCTLMVSTSQFAFISSTCTSTETQNLRLAVNVTCGAIPPPRLNVPAPTCGGAVNGGIARLSCAPYGPDYVISDVQFAAYGQPQGRCNAFNTSSLFNTPGNCASIDSMFVVQAACLGRKSCAISVESSLFSKFSKNYVGALVKDTSCGTSNPDLSRWLFVQASCSVPDSSSRYQLFYASGVQVSSVTSSASLACLNPNMVISSVDFLSLGEIQGSFYEPIGSSVSLGNLLPVNFSASVPEFLNPPENYKYNTKACVACSYASTQVGKSSCLMAKNCTVKATLSLATDAYKDCWYRDKWSPSLFIQGRCFGCAPGSAFTSYGKSLDCSPCPLGFYSDEVGGRRCLQTPNGAQPTTAKGSGVYASFAAGGYTTCEPGKFYIFPGPSSSGLSAACQTCADGTISEPFPFPTRCTSCQGGQEPQERRRCTDCPFGWFSQLGDNSCTISPPGAFPSSQMGSGTLVTVRAAGFTECPPGTFNPEAGGATCSVCGRGTFSKAGASSCLLAPPGTMVDSDGMESTTPCPIGTHSAVAGSVGCLPCSYPKSNSHPGMADCPNINMSVSTGNLAAVLTVTLFVFCACIASTGRDMGPKILANVAFPALDVFSDLSYILTSSYYSFWLFGLSVVAYSYGIPYFASFLIENRIGPNLWLWPYKRAYWLGYSKSNDPIYFATVNGQRLLNLDSHSNLALVLVEAAIWLIALAAQALTLLIWPVFSGMYFFLQAFWFVLGAYLHMTKLLSIGSVWNCWVYTWRGFVVDIFTTDVVFDTEEHNTSLRNEFYFETLPQFCLQIANNTLIETWSPVAIFSAAFSIVMAGNGIYRILYFSVLLDEPLALFQIPTGNLLRLGMTTPIKFDLILDTRMPSCKRSYTSSPSPLSLLQRKTSLASSIHQSTGNAGLASLGPPMLYEARAVFYRFFQKYVPIDGVVSEQDTREAVDQLLDLPQYSGAEEELFADVVGELYGMHPREQVLKHAQDRIPVAVAIATGGSESGNATRVSTFEMSNPIAAAAAGAGATTNTAPPAAPKRISML